MKSRWIVRKCGDWGLNWGNLPCRFGRVGPNNVKYIDINIYNYNCNYNNKNYNNIDNNKLK